MMITAVYLVSMFKLLYLWKGFILYLKQKKKK